MQNNKLISVAIFIVALFLIVFLGAKTRNAWLEYNYIGKSGRDTINIEGQGKVTAVPDIAQVQLGVVTDGLTVKEIQQKNTDKMNAIIKAVKELGVEAKDIQTDNYNLNPRYDWTDGQQKLIGYTVSQNVTVKVRDLEKVGDVVAKGGELGSNQIGGVQFVIDDPLALQAQARDKAIDDAKQKADVLAKKLGLNIARVVSFSEYSSGSPYPMPYLAMEKAMDSSSVRSSAPTIEPGTQDVVTNVTVTFEVR